MCLAAAAQPPLFLASSVSGDVKPVHWMAASQRDAQSEPLSSTQLLVALPGASIQVVLQFAALCRKSQGATGAHSQHCTSCRNGTKVSVKKRKATTPLQRMQVKEAAKPKLSLFSNAGASLRRRARKQAHVTRAAT